MKITLNISRQEFKDLKKCLIPYDDRTFIESHVDIAETLSNVFKRENIK